MGCRHDGKEKDRHDRVLTLVDDENVDLFKFEANADDNLNAQKNGISRWFPAFSQCYTMFQKLPPSRFLKQ